MVVMLHEIEYEKEHKRYQERSSLVLKGENDEHTAMAKTVGLPLAIAAKLILNGKISLKGLHIPISKEVYQPVLQELSLHGIAFTEQKTEIG